MRLAIAIFAKTPGFTPAKTRLAARLGVSVAEQVHAVLVARSVRLAKACLRAGYYVRFAIAENHPDAFAWWQRHGVEVIWTGPGSLGQRMQRVHDCLCVVHGNGVLLGTDVPAMSAYRLDDVVRQLIKHRMVFGPALDGGMYLFASRLRLPPRCWHRPVWGGPSAGQEFLQGLRRFSSVRPICLEPLPDFDVFEDWPLNEPYLAPCDADRVRLDTLLS